MASPPNKNHVIYDIVEDILAVEGAEYSAPALKALPEVAAAMPYPSVINDVVSSFYSRGLFDRRLDDNSRSFIYFKGKHYVPRAERGPKWRPKDEHRPKKGPAPSVDEKLQARVEEAKATQKAKAIPPQYVEPVPAPEPEVIASHTPTPVALPASLPPLGLNDLIESIAQQLGAAIAERITLEVRANLPGQLNKLKDTYLNELKAPPKVRLPRVVIIGLLPQQAGMISQEFGAMLDLNFIETDSANSKRIGELLRHEPHVFAMCNFMSHAIENMVKATPHYHRISGGMSRLRDELTNVACAA